MLKNLIIRKEYNNRQSNIELLRIVSMFAILFWHGVHHGFQTVEGEDASSILFLDLLSWLLLWHVNVFLLITGFWGIKFRLKRLFIFCAYVSFYSILTSLIVPYLLGKSIDISSIYNIPYNLFRNGLDYWFVKYYILLYLLSPLLNCVKDFNTRNYIRVLLIFIFIDVCLGYFFKVEDNMGFSIQHFCLMYVLGDGIRRLQELNKGLNGKFIIGLFAFSTIICIVLDYKVGGYYSLCCYNNPFVIISSILVFLFFLRINIKSNLVNFIAGSAFSVYLLTDNPCFVRPFLVNKITTLYTYIPDIYISISIWLLASILIFIFCISLDIFLKSFLNFILHKR